MKKILMVLVILIGCTDGEEYASINLQKGDEFFAKGEYEIAEYYYDKIPEDSPLFKSAQRNLAIIEKQKENIVAEEVSGVKVDRGLTIVGHTYLLRLGRVPIHKVTILNGTSKKLQFADLEFVYIDGSGREIKRLTGTIYQDIGPNEQKEVSEIAPGMIDGKFERVEVNFKRTFFY